MLCALEDSKWWGLRGEGQGDGEEREHTNKWEPGRRKAYSGWIQVVPRLLGLSHRRLTSEIWSRKKEEGTVLQAQDGKPVMMLRTQMSISTVAFYCRGASWLFPVLSGYQGTSDVDHSCTRLFRFFSSSGKTFNTCWLYMLKILVAVKIQFSPQIPRMFYLVG